MRKIRLIFVMSLGLISCTITPFYLAQSDVPQTVLDVPVGNYDAIIRFPDGQILIAEHRKDPIIIQSGERYIPIKNEEPMRFYDLDDKQLLEIPALDDERCRKTDYGLPNATPDGQLAFRVLCHGRWPDRPLGQDGATYIMAYDWDGSTFKQLVADPLPDGASAVTWHPDMKRGVQDLGSMFATIYWVTPEGMEPITLTLQEGNRSWSLDENLAILLGDEDRLNVGIAESSAWSPDGQWIAFVASLEAIGKDGFDRVRASQNLYLLDPKTLQTKEILTGITDTRGSRSLTWSPDSQWILISGQIRNIKGLWVTSIDGQVLELVDPAGNRSFEGEAWQDSQTIIAIKCVNADIPCNQTEIIQYDLSSIVQ